MKKSILIVGYDKELSREVAHNLALVTKMSNIDADEMLNGYILKKDNIDIQYAGEIFNDIEKICVKNLTNSTNCVVNMSVDMLVSGDNIDRLKSSFNMFYLHMDKKNLFKDKSYKTKQEAALFDEIDTLLKQCCIVLYDCNSASDVVKNIIEYLNKM